MPAAGQLDTPKGCVLSVPLAAFWTDRGTFGHVRKNVRLTVTLIVPFPPLTNGCPVITPYDRAGRAR